MLHSIRRVVILGAAALIVASAPASAQVSFVGEWKSTKKFNRVNDIDIHEVECLPDLNDHLKSTRSKTQVK